MKVRMNLQTQRQVIQMKRSRVNVTSGSYPLTFFLTYLKNYNSRLNRVVKNLNPARVNDNKQAIRDKVAKDPALSLLWAYAIFNSVNERGTKLLTLRFHDLHTFRDIAKAWYLSPERIRQLQYAYIVKLQKKDYLIAVTHFLNLTSHTPTDDEIRNAMIALFGEHEKTIDYYNQFHFNDLFNLDIKTQAELDEYIRKE